MNKIEGSAEDIHAAVFIPDQDGVLSVSADRYRHCNCESLKIKQSDVLTWLTPLCDITKGFYNLIVDKIHIKSSIF